jgi:hypothetical protein
MPSFDDQQWPKHIKAKLLLTPIKLLILDGLQLIYEEGMLWCFSGDLNQQI